jgi:hypothetical protein
MVRVVLPDPDATLLLSGLQATSKTELVCHVNAAWIAVSVGVVATAGAMVGIAVAVALIDGLGVGNVGVA